MALPRARTLGVIAAFVLIFVAGAVLGAVASSRMWGQALGDTHASGDAARLLISVSLARQLREGNTAAVQEHLENEIDGATVALGLAAPEKRSGIANRALKKARDYRQVHPSTSSSAGRVAEVLAGVPSR